MVRIVRKLDFADMQSAALSSTVEINLQEAEGKYTDKVIQASRADSVEIRDTIVQDFDKNGTVEAFIFVGGEPDAYFTSTVSYIYYVDNDSFINANYSRTSRVKNK